MNSPSGEPSSSPGPSTGSDDAAGRGRCRRWWLPLGVLVASGTAALVLEWSEFWARAVLIRVIVLAAAALVVGWWVLLDGSPARVKGRRFVGVVLGGAVLALVLPRLFRIEGSADGSAVPKVVWRWAASASPGPLPERVGRPTDAATAGALPELAGLADFPGFLGEGRAGVLPGPPLATDWEREPPEERWRIPVGKGWSGFAVSAAERLALTQEQRGAEECVTAYDLATGRLAWVRANKALFSESMGGDGPRATPTLADDVAFVQGATGRLECLRVADGSVVWSRDILADHDLANLEYGKANSPLVVDDLVVVTGGDAGRDSLIACRRDTGETVWTGGDDRAAYSSPEVAVLGGVRQIVVVNAESASGHDPADGRTLWRFAWPGKFPKVAQPRFPGDDHVLLSASYGAGTFLVAVGPLDGPTGRQDVREVWRSNRLKTKFSSAIVRDGFAYGLDEGSFACVDLADGRRLWKEARYGYGQNLLVGDLFLIQAERGPVILARADPDSLEEVARLPALSAKTWNPPALAGRFLLVRNDREAACYQLPVAAEAPPVPANERP